MANISTATALLPKHIAIVMDGNGRWATKRMLPRKLGHSRGLESLRRCIAEAIKLNIPTISVFAFSSENWQRSEDEINAIMEIMATSLPKETPLFVENSIKIKFVGSHDKLQPSIVQQLRDSEQKTKNGSKLNLNICFNYGGKWDIVQATQYLQQQQIAITEQSIAQHLSLAEFTDPDLLIRTGGEQRISNFLLWQLAYTEIYFSNKLWPDFNAEDLQQAINWYKKRERRFGKTSAQINNQ